jgi:hypothetical protein
MVDNLTEEYINKLEMLCKAYENQLANYKLIVKLKDEIITEYEQRMKAVSEMIPALVG